MTIVRRRFLLTLLATAAALPAAVRRRAAGAIDTDDLEEFERILKSGLRARRPEEIAFIGKVVQMVRDHKLPRRLLESAFVWVRKKKHKERYPAVWFERSLRALAAREGFVIP